MAGCYVVTKNHFLVKPTSVQYNILITSEVIFSEILGVVSNTGVLFSSDNLIEEFVLRNVGRFFLGDLFWLFWPFLESRAQFCKVLSTIPRSASFGWLVYVFNRSFQQTVFGEDCVSSQWICIWDYCITDSKPQNLHFGNFFNKFLTCHIFHLCSKTTTARNYAKKCDNKEHKLQVWICCRFRIMVNLS